MGEEAACHENLRDAKVGFERVRARDARGVDWPIKLSSSIGGVRVYGGARNAPTNYLDCRLALALVAWAPQLRDAGVVALRHYSMYRRDAKVGKSDKVSAHALGRAIDVAFFELADGRTLSVLNDWKDRRKGVEPCAVASPEHSAEKIMRELVCGAVERGVFQLVLTPHYNSAHENHLHLELKPRAAAWLG